VSFLRAYFSPPFCSFPFPGRAFLFPDFAPALAIQTFAL
jgi:hypothetical protein